MIHQCRSVVLSSVATLEEQPHEYQLIVHLALRLQPCITATYGGAYRLSDVPFARLSPSTATFCYPLWHIFHSRSPRVCTSKPSLVAPYGGSFCIPENDQRFDLTPPNLMVMSKKINYTYEREMLYVWRM